MKYFDEYISNYDMSDKEINYKYYHSYRVMDIMELLAKKLNLNEIDTHVAKVIGILHDIGRFEQDKLYDSFKDRIFDHGNYGAKILRETNILDKTGIKKADYEVVCKAVDNHNQFQIDEGLTERELFFAKLIRDADKLDILYSLGQEDILELKQDDNEITLLLEEKFFGNRPGTIKNVNNLNDGIVIEFCYIYDINFNCTYEILEKEKYYDKIFERINRKDIFKKYLDYANNYIKERIDENVR